MKLTLAQDGAVSVLRLSGRLDGDGAAQLADSLEQLLREGSRAAALDLRDIGYISTPGLQAISLAQQEFAAVRGDLRVTGLSPAVREALDAADMGGLVSDKRAGGGESTSRASSVFRRRSSATTWSSAATQTWKLPHHFLVRGRYEVVEAPFQYSTPEVRCRLVGDPAWTGPGEIPRDACRVVEFGESSFGLGIGALGDDVEEALPRLGELVGAQGVVAAQPTDGANVPDYLMGLQGKPARGVLGSGLVLEGPFARTVRFAKLPEHDGVSLSELAHVCCELTGGQPTAIVAMVEVHGLVGAWLRRSPGGERPGFTMQVPAVRDWLGLSPERIHEGTSALVVGVVAKESEAGALAPWLRPLGNRSECVGHFHAAVFAFRPVPLRTVQPRVLVTKYFTQQRTRAVLHLLSDDRGASGAGESEFLRGTCWTSPIADIGPLA